MVSRKIKGDTLFKRLVETVKRRFVIIYFSLLFLGLLLVYLPSLTYPPRSDFWSTAYFFHRIAALANPFTKWLHILQYDPWSQVRFQPLAYVILYLERVIFGSNFSLFHLLNFGLYFLSVILIYGLAVNFCQNKLLVYSFIGIFAFLYSHFDIISWSYHAYIVFGFCSLLSAFILYIQFLKSGRSLFLPFVVLLFLAGMFCYETFFLWPLAIVILGYIGDYPEGKAVQRSKINRSYFLVIGSVYLFYGLSFLLSRIFSVYDFPADPLSQLFSFKVIVFNIFTACFNVIYNGLLINFLPFLAAPALVTVNLNLGGELDKIPSQFIGNLIFAGGGVFILGVLLALFVLIKRKGFRTIKIISFFFFLMFSEVFILFYCRTVTNNAVFSLTQFRYLYIPNAFVILSIMYSADVSLRRNNKGRLLAVCFLCLVLVFNIYTTRKYGLAVLTRQLTPLKIMFSNIKKGMSVGQITPEKRLFLSNGLTKIFPELCWNAEMGEYFMRGTYQWVFTDDEIKCFSSYNEAKWVVNEKDFSIINKQERLKNEKPIN